MGKPSAKPSARPSTKPAAKPAAARADEPKPEPRARERTVGGASSELNGDGRRFQRRDDERRAERPARARALRGASSGSGRKASFVDDLAAIAAEDDDADDAFASSLRATNPSRPSAADAEPAAASTREDPLSSRGVSEADRLEAAARLAELRSRWEFAEVLAFLTAFRRELRAGARRANKALGLRATHWAAAASTAAELERALADPEGKLAFEGEASEFPAEAPVEGLKTAGGRDGDADADADAAAAAAPPAAETVSFRRRARRAATLARTHLSLLFGLEPETHVSDKPPAGGWSKRWPEWTAHVSGERVAELFGARERRAPFDRSAFETIVEVDEADGETLDARDATDAGETTDAGDAGGLREQPKKKRAKSGPRRFVARRSAAEAYAAVTPTRRVRALWGLCEARLACDDIRERLGGADARGGEAHRGAGALKLGAADADSGGAYWYVGRRENEDDEKTTGFSRETDSDDSDDADAARDVACGVARVFRAAPPRWDVYAEPLAEKRLGDSKETPLDLRARSEPDPRVGVPGSGSPGSGSPGSGSPGSGSESLAADGAASPRAVAGGHPSSDGESLSPRKEALPVSPRAAPSRGALEYAERAVWADAASAEADSAARWAFVLEEARGSGSAGSSSGGDGSESSEEDDLSDLDSPSPKRRRRRRAPRAGKRSARGARRETVEVRFARRARCAVSDVICSLASEGKWLETRDDETKRSAARKASAAEKAAGSERDPVRGAKPDSKKKRRRDGRDVPPYHRFAASFVSAPPLGDADDAARTRRRIEAAREADAMVRLDDIPCAWCGDGSGESAFVLCDGCPNGGHLACLGLRGVPKNRWFCAVCADGGEGADAPRTRVVRRLAHPRFVGVENRPRAPREGAWETVAEERALWESPDASPPASVKSAIETHASFAMGAFARASARRREATRRAAASARAERASLDARRAERRALRDDDFRDDESLDESLENDTEDDTEDDSDRSEGARVAKSFASEQDEADLEARLVGGDGGRDADDARDGVSRGRTSPKVLFSSRGRLGPAAAVLTSGKENEPLRLSLCARCGEPCVLDAAWEVERPRVGLEFAKCAFCPAEGHRACVFGDALEACAVCARKKTLHPASSRDGPGPSPAVRAPPSPVARRAFPRRVPTRVRRALWSDDDDAWRFE